MYGVGNPTHLYTTNQDDFWRTPSAFYSDTSCNKGPDETNNLWSNPVYVATANLPPYINYLIEMRGPSDQRLAYVGGSSADYNKLKQSSFSEVRIVGYLPQTLNIRNTSFLTHFMQINPPDCAFADPAETARLNSAASYSHNTTMLFFTRQSSSGYCSLAIGKLFCTMLTIIIAPFLFSHFFQTVK